MQVYTAVIEAKVLYGLNVAWLSKSERARLGGFQARCVRRVLRILASYYSRVSKHTVLANESATPEWQIASGTILNIL